LTVGTPRARFYVLTVGTYGAVVFPLPYVLTVGTGCTHHWYGILFFPPGAARDIGEQFAVPFRKIPGGRLCPVCELREAIARCNTATITPEKSVPRLA